MLAQHRSGQGHPQALNRATMTDLLGLTHMLHKPTSNVAATTLTNLAGWDV